MTNTEIVAAFYEAFRRRDYKTMQSFYADNAVFSDPVFQNLSAPEVKSMWGMLLSRSKDITVDYTVDEGQGDEVKARWTAIYTFTATGRRVVNHIHSKLTLKGGKIIRQTDSFPFAKWARQALGWKGWLFGGMSFLKNKVRATAMNGLKVFMSKKEQ